MKVIIGIDFSGAKHDRGTWAARGQIAPDGILELQGVEMTPRKEVIRLLSEVPAPCVAGLDIPFGVPHAFAEFLSTGANETMPDVWRVLADLSLEDFIAARDAFVARFGERKRAGDASHFPESYSPLHKANPNMLPMTYYGIEMLRKLHESDAGRWIVPPLQSPDAATDENVTLLETMPGAFLKAIGTIYKGYKKPKSARQRDERRNIILDALECASGVRLLNLSAVRDKCLASDDCLDSVVAAVAAASWTRNAAGFRHPAGDELAIAKLEGWIYVPQSAE